MSRDRDSAEYGKAFGRVTVYDSTGGDKQGNNTKKNTLFLTGGKFSSFGTAMDDFSFTLHETPVFKILNAGTYSLTWNAFSTRSTAKEQRIYFYRKTSAGDVVEYHITGGNVTSIPSATCFFMCGEGDQLLAYSPTEAWGLSYYRSANHNGMTCARLA